MRDVALFTRILALPNPWRVERVGFDPEEQQVDFWLAHRRNAAFTCPECGTRSPLHDHLPWRRWRHLDHGECVTWLHARPPRVDCPEHGIHQVRLPWALPGCRFTIPFERHAIDVLLQADVLGGAGLLRISWDEAWHLMERAVTRGRQAKPRRVMARLGVDEKAASKGHRYVTLVFDLDRSTVEYIADDRKKTSLDAFYLALSPEQRAGIEAVAMDMWEPFIASTAEHVPEGRSKIVFDRFHVMKHMTEAVDAVRKWEHRRLQADGDDTLKKTKYLWLYSAENLPESSRERFAALRALHLKTGRAWAIKESLRDLWEYRRRGWAVRHWRRWYFWATHSRLKPVIAVARMIRGHLDNVLTYVDHRITTATCEGSNSKIQAIKKTPMASAIGTI
jgi:transposase